MEVIDQHADELKKLCARYHVAELYVFGSVAKGNFTDSSDIDFLVRFIGVNPPDYFDNYMDFKAELELLYLRKIDLVEVQTIKNPILKKSIDRNKIILYGRENTEVVV
ncbi:MAG: nucleotidyltransferase domain-containing protein [Flammeovirgaceae bacterium]|nr:nucleotidyltransferase domain-containing protein [Flammeovirgaceae bacterium]